MRANWILSLGAMLLVLNLMPANHRVLSDETNLLSVSKNFFEYEKPFVTYDAKLNSQGKVSPITQVLPLRPLGYSYLIHVLHRVSGYHYTNAYLLNLGLFFLTAFILLTLLSDKTNKMVFVLFLLSNSLVYYCVRSTGYEVFHLSLLVSSLFALNRFIKLNNQESFFLFWCLALTLCHSRYEGILYVGIMSIFVCWIQRPSYRVLGKYLPLYATTPVFLLPFLWQRMIHSDLLSYPSFPNIPIFGVGHFLNNSHSFVKHLLKSPFTDGVSSLPLWTMVLGGVLLLFVMRKRNESPMIYPLTAIACVHFMIFMWHSAGDIERPTVIRYFLPNVFLGSFLLAYLSNFVSLKKRVVVAIACGVYCLMCIPTIVRTSQFHTLIRTQKENTILAQLQNYDPSRTLIVTDRPNIFTPYNFSAIDYVSLRKERLTLPQAYDRGLYDTILISNILHTGIGELDARERRKELVRFWSTEIMPAWIPKELVFEHPITENYVSQLFKMSKLQPNSKVGRRY